MSAKDSQFIERALEHPWMFYVYFWKWPRIVRQTCAEYDLLVKERDAVKSAHEQAVRANKIVRDWIHVTHRLDMTADMRAIWTAGKRLSALLLFVALTLSANAQLPPILRQQWTTNADPRAVKVISTNGVQAATNVWEVDFTNTASVTVSAVSNANKVMLSFTGAASGGGDTVWTNDGIWIWPAGTPSPGSSPGPPFMIRDDGSIFIGTNIALDFGISNKTFLRPFSAFSMIDSNDPAIILVEMLVNDNSDEYDLDSDISFQVKGDKDNGYISFSGFSYGTNGNTGGINFRANPSGSEGGTIFRIHTNFSSVFQVVGNGNISDIRGVSGYSWPTAHAAGVWTNDGAGVTGWKPLSDFVSGGSGIATQDGLGTNTTLVTAKSITVTNLVASTIASQFITNSSAIHLPGSTTSNTFQAGTFGIQSYAVNNGWLSDNAYFDGGFFRRRDAGDATFAYFFGGYQIRFGASGAAGSAITLYTPFNFNHTAGAAGNFNLASDAQIAWQDNVNATAGTRDVALRRSAAGVLLLDNGAFAGARRDMILRTLSATNINVGTSSNFTVDAAGTITTTGAANITGGITNDTLTASKLVRTDATKKLVSSTLDESDIANLAATKAITNVTRTVITNVGVSLYTVPAGVKYIYVECIGGGGGGGGVDGATSQSCAGGGGGSGAYCTTNIVSPAASYIVTVGTNGLGGAAGNNNGTIGGTTTFTNILTALGGSGGSGDASAAAVGFAIGGAGALETATGYVYSGGSPGQHGICMSATLAVSGGGAGSIFGGGGAPQTAAAGANATGKGAGGSGAAAITNIDRAGGNGSPGVIMIRELYQ